MNDVFVIRDDYDQSTLCVVRADSEDAAIREAQEAGFNGQGDLYAVQVPFLEAA